MQRSQPKAAINKTTCIVLGLIIVVACIISIGFRTTSERPYTNISPCLLPTLPVPCNEELDKMRINYTQTTYGFPAAYKITATSERVTPQPFMSTANDIVSFNLPALLSDVVIWSALLLGVASLVRKHR